MLAWEASTNIKRLTKIVSVDLEKEVWKLNIVQLVPTYLMLSTLIKENLV